MGVKQRKSHHESKDRQPEPSADDNISDSNCHAKSSRSERMRHRSVWQLFKSSIKYILLVIAVPPFLNYASLIREQQELLPETGALYDVGFGQKLFLRCMGSGHPTVIMDAPTGMNSDVWALIQPRLAKMTKVCVYDRAGLGFSDRPSQNMSNPQLGEEAFVQNTIANKWQSFTVERMADDLHRLVTFSSSQEKPFILVGAEIGATVGRFYAQIYEAGHISDLWKSEEILKAYIDVSDLILIDPLVENLITDDASSRVWTNFWFGQLLPSFQTLQLTAALGLTRLALLMGLMVHPIQGENIPEDVERRQKHLLCHPRHLSSVVDEHHFINDTFSQMKTVFMMKQFPANISVTVLNGNYYDEQLPSSLNVDWARTQQHLLSQIHPGSKHILVNGADRHMLYKKPQVIIEQIQKLVRARRLVHAS